MNPFLTPLAIDRIPAYPLPTYSTRVFASYDLHICRYMTLHNLSFPYIYPESFTLQTLFPNANPLHQYLPRFRQKYQIISVEQLPWQSIPELPRERLQHNREQQRAKYRPLVHAHFHLKFLTLFTLHSHCSCHSNVHRTPSGLKASFSSTHLLKAISFSASLNFHSLHLLTNIFFTFLTFSFHLTEQNSSLCCRMHGSFGITVASVSILMSLFLTKI